MKHYGKRPDDIPYEPLLAQVLVTETGYPAHISIVRDAYGRETMPSEKPGWFWIFATPLAAADIRRRGLCAVGSVTRTFIPPQVGTEIDERVDPIDIPVVGTQEHTELMLREKGGA